MKKVSLFIAMSLDGYIADCKGSVERLTGQGNEVRTFGTSHRGTAKRKRN